MKKILVLALLAFLGFAPAAQASLPPAQVFIVAGSNINMVSRESKVPVSVQNNYDRPIRIRVHAVSNNSAVVVEKYVSLTIPANSRKDALLPVKVISNGEYNLKVWVTTFTDIRIGESVYLKINANPDFELVILVSFGAVVIGLIGLGAYRMIRRKRANA